MSVGMSNDTIVFRRENTNTANNHFKYVYKWSVLKMPPFLVLGKKIILLPIHPNFIDVGF